MSRDSERYKPDPDPPIIHLVSILDPPELWEALAKGEKVPLYKFSTMEVYKLLDGANVRIQRTFWDEKLNKAREEFWMAELIRNGNERFIKLLYRAD